MIQLETKFPNPGSYADHAGQRCRILSHEPGNMVLLSPADGIGPRRAPFAELTDPSDEDVREKALLAGFGEADTRRALWIASHLRNANETSLQDLDRAMRDAARQGKVAACYDRGHLSRILRRLDWTSVRRRNAAGLMTTDYIRTPLASAA